MSDRPPVNAEREPEKYRVLQMLLDTQVLAGELFDEIDEDDGLRPTTQRVLKIHELVTRLTAVRQALLLKLVMSRDPEIMRLLRETPADG